MMRDKRLTEDEAVAELADGMTIGIGGWGSRRKRMSLVRALLRSDLRDLTVVSYGGPDVGLLCAAVVAYRYLPARADRAVHEDGELATEAQELAVLDDGILT